MAPIIRTCSVAVLLLAQSPVQATAKPYAPSPLANYVAARMLDEKAPPNKRIRRGAVIRVQKETAVTVMFPDNPIARESVDRYLEALKAVFQRIAESGRHREPLEVTASSVG